jgi:hypothetical protein
METFCKLFGSLLVFVYHCFDRIVIQGYLPLLTRPEHIVHFFRDVQGIYPLTKQALAKRTHEYQQWVEAFARNHRIPIQWPDPNMKKKRRISSVPTASPWSGASGLACISSSRAWNRGRPSVPCRRSILPTIPITGSCTGTDPATHIITSISATKCSVPW